MFHIQTSPHLSIEQKLNGKKCAYNKKFGSPKLRDMLREKCRLRIKESRCDAFDGTRNITDSNRNLLRIIIDEELRELNFDIELQEIISKNMIDEANEWLYITSLEETETFAEEDSTIFCPICQINELQQHAHNGQIVCFKCNIKFYSNTSLAQFHLKLRIKIDEHETSCGQQLIFFYEPSALIPDTMILSTMCDSCDFYYTFK